MDCTVDEAADEPAADGHRDDDADEQPGDQRATQPQPAVCKQTPKLSLHALKLQVLRLVQQLQTSDVWHGVHEGESITEINLSTFGWRYYLVTTSEKAYGI